MVTVPLRVLVQRDLDRDRVALVHGVGGLIEAHTHGWQVVVGDRSRGGGIFDPRVHRIAQGNREGLLFLLVHRVIDDSHCERLDSLSRCERQCAELLLVVGGVSAVSFEVVQSTVTTSSLASLNVTSKTMPPTSSRSLTSSMLSDDL